MKAAILSAILAGAIGSGGTYTVMQYQQPNLAAAVQQGRVEQAKLDASNVAYIDSFKQTSEQLAELVQVQKAALEVLKSGSTAELAQAVTLDEHVLQIACLIKGCPKQALR